MWVLLDQLQSLKIRLDASDGKLYLDAPPGVVTDEIRASVKVHKAALISYLEELKNTKETASIPKLSAIMRNAPLTLSFAQQRLWFLDQLEQAGAAYNIPLSVRLTGQLDIVALSGTLNEIVRRHEVLRTTFAMADGMPVQVIAPQLKISLPLVDLSGLPHAEREAKALWLVQDEAQTPFDLATGPLIRAGLIRLGDTGHVVLFTMHHIVSDGWSMGVLINEVAALYGAYVQGKPSPLPELPIQYADFAYWQRQWLSGEVLQQQLGYWSRQLGGSPTLLELPTDRPRPPVQTYRGAYLHFSISNDTASGLAGLCKQTQTTLFMLLTAAFNVLLSRYTNQGDICIGTPIANRNRAEIESLIGFFINTLVLRTQVDGEKSFNALLQQVRTITLDAYAHQDVPFEQLVEVLKPERHTSHSPLFQTMLILQNTPTESLELPGLALELLTADNAVAKYDLTLNAIEDGSRLLAMFEYNTDLFDQGTIQRMAGHFTRLLDAVVTNPEMRIADLPMLSPAEQTQLLVEWNDTATEYPQDQMIHQLFEAQAEKTPGNVAAVFEGEQLTYAQLNARSNQLAHYLRSRGVGPDVLVGLCVERSLEMVVGLLGILKAGGAYVPLDPAYPKERLAYMLEDAQPAVLLTQQRLQETGRAAEIAIFYLDSQWQELTAYPAANPHNNTLPGNLAYVIYTSGSTGKPKGVGVYQRSLVNFIDTMQQKPGICKEDVLLSVTSLSFDIAALELFLPLAAGACTILTSRETAANPQQLTELIEQCKVSMMQATPSTWRMLVNHGWPNLDRALKVLCGGEALPGDLAAQMLDHTPVIWNMYGPTETTIWSAVHGIASAQANPSIGQPIGNTQIYILDAALNMVPVGVAGELHIAGDGLARGYLHRPDLTADKFIANPFSKKPGARMYKSGDLARYLSDGNIDYLGRIDNQVKIRGFRIELGEIEATLQSLEKIEQAVVIAREDVPGDKRLVAYVVASGESAELDAGELRKALLQSLPEYMVPACFMVLDKLPLTPNGKLDRKALPAPDMVRSEAEYVAPGTETEKTLARIWQEMLGVDRVGIHDNFFDLGGHSLLVVQLVRHLKEVNINLTIRQAYENPTISGIIHSHHYQPAETPIVDQSLVTGKSPLLANQYWVLRRRLPLHWNCPILLELLIDVDVEVLQKAIGDVLEHHDGLRRIFVKENNLHHQLFQAPEAMEKWWHYIDVSNIEADSISENIEGHCARLQASLDIYRVLFKVAYFDLGQGKNPRLFFCISHILLDPSSTPMFYGDLMNRYTGLIKKSAQEFPPKTTSIKTWAEWQLKYAQEGALAYLPYWRSRSWKKFRNFPEEEFPDDLAEDTGSTMAAFVIAYLNPVETLMLENLVVGTDVQVEHLLVAALILAWEKWTRNAALFLLFVHNGRAFRDADEIDLSRTVGWLGNYSNIMFDLGDETSSLKKAVFKVKEQMNELQDGGLSYTCLRDMNSSDEIRAEMNALPKFQLEFSYLPRERKAQKDSESIFSGVMQIAPEPFGNSEGLMKSAFPPFGKAYHDNDRLVIHWGYSPCQHSRQTMDALLENQLSFLRKILKEYNPD